jgi:uncharacterized protein YdcH (DUF465 family)
MTHTPHELADEFPDLRQRIHDLKTTDERFAHLAERYHALNREIHRIDAGIEGASDEHAETLKKQRLQLKDRIAGMLRAPA